MEIFQEIPFELWTIIFNEILLDNLYENILVHDFEKLTHIIACILYYHKGRKIIADVELLRMMIVNKKNILINQNINWPVLQKKSIKIAYKSTDFEIIISNEINIALDMQHQLLKLQNIKHNLLKIFSGENLIMIDELLNKYKKIAEECRSCDSTWLMHCINMVNICDNELNNILKTYIYALNKYMFLIKNNSPPETTDVVLQKMGLIRNFQSIIQIDLIDECGVISVAAILLYTQNKLEQTYDKLVSNIDILLEYQYILLEYYYNTIFKNI